MKHILILLLSLPVSANMIAQDTTIVYFNNKKAAQVVIKPDQTEAFLQIKKMDYKRSKTFVIKVFGEHIGNELYKRSLEISGQNSIFTEETKNKPGHFDISKTETAKIFLDGKSISLYLLLNPSNPRMKMPSKRIYLGNLVMK